MSAPAAPITCQTAIHFLETKLGIENVVGQLQHTRLNLLHDICRQWLYRIPFQDVTQIAQPDSEKTIPDEADTVRDIVNGSGGLCWTHNMALYYVLKALEYDVYLTISAVMRENELNHTLPIVRNVERQGDMYLLDVGTGYPSFTAISLNFESHSPVFKESFVTYRLEKQGNLIKRLHLTKDGKDRTDRPYPVYDNEGWADYFYVWLEEKTLDYIKKELDKNVYSDPTFRFNTSIRACKFPNAKLVAVKDDTLIMETEDGTIQATSLDGPGAVKSALLKYFPEIPEGIVDKAICNWKTVYYK